MERAAPPALAERRERREPDVDEEIVRTIDCTREHDIGPIVVEPVTRILDRVERTRASGVEGKGAGFELERAFENQRRQPRSKSIARIGSWLGRRKV